MESLPQIAWQRIVKYIDREDLQALYRAYPTAPYMQRMASFTIALFYRNNSIIFQTIDIILLSKLIDDSKQFSQLRIDMILSNIEPYYREFLLTEYDIKKLFLLRITDDELIKCLGRCPDILNRAVTMQYTLVYKSAAILEYLIIHGQKNIISFNINTFRINIRSNLCKEEIREMLIKYNL